MCTVQVLLFADVVRRADSTSCRSTSSAPPRAICRRLFADDNNNNQNNSAQSRTALLRTLESEMENQVRHKWNFDFRTGRPLAGRYQWEAVGQRVPPTDSLVSEEVIGQSETDSKENRPSTPCFSQQINRHKCKQATQSKITDFLQKRKRHLRSDSDLSSSPKTKSRRRLQVDCVTVE